MNHESSEVIAEVFGDWLNEEVKSSGIEINPYLDKLDDAVKGLKGGRQHPNNFFALKHASHVDIRLPQTWQTFNMSLEPDATNEEIEYQSAYMMFTPLMQVSGAYRVQCYMEARDQKDYTQKRLSKPVAVNLERTVNKRLAIWLPEPDNFGEATITVEQLGNQLERVSRIGARIVAEVCQRGSRGFDFGVERSVTAQMLKTGQKEWTSFATDCVILAAKQRRGELSAVPFLEPKSITATPPPEIIYPLAA